MRKVLWVCVLLGFYPVFSQRNKIDSLRSALLKISNKTVMVDTYVRLASVYRRVNLDSMYYFGAEANELSRRIAYKNGEAGANLMMGISQLRRGDLTDAMELSQKALELALVGRFADVEAEALNNIGLTFNYQGNYPTAMDYYQRAHSVAESVKNKPVIASVLTNMGGIYYNLRDYNRALDYWKQSLELQKELSDNAGVAVCLSNIGLAYSEMGEYPMALKYYFQSLYSHDANSLCTRIYPLENIGSTYFKMGHQDSAVVYLQQALKGAQECNHPVAEIGVLAALADVSKAKREMKTAMQYLDRAIRIGNLAGLKRETSIVAKSLSELHEQLGNTKEAFSIFKTYHALRDSIYNADNAKAIGKLEAKYEYDSAKKEQEIARRLENVEKEKILARERWIRNTFISGFVVMIFVAGLIYRNFRRKQISNQRLELLNGEIKAQQAALVSQSDQLKQLNESLSELNAALEVKVAERTRQLIDKNNELEKKNAKLADYAFINAHKLRAPVATIMGLVKLFEVDTDGRNDIVTRIKHSTEELNDVVKEIRITLEKEKSKSE